MYLISFLILMTLATTSWSQEFCQPLLRPSTKHEIVVLNKSVTLKKIEGFCELNSSYLSGLLLCNQVKKNGNDILCSSSLGQTFTLDSEGFPKDGILSFSAKLEASLMNLSSRRNLPKGKKLIKWPVFEKLNFKLGLQQVSLLSQDGAIRVTFQDSKKKDRTCKTLWLSKSVLICDGKIIYPGSI